MAAAGERGGAFVALVTVVAIGLGAFWSLGRLDPAGPFRSRADRVARAAAEAGAAEGPEAAWLIATGSGGELVAFEALGADAVVTVEVAGVTAVGRARRKVSDPLGGLGGATRAGLAPDLLAALARADSLMGRPVPITSGLRSAARQAQLYANRASNPFPVAFPGRSRHESGEAVDVPMGVASQLAALAPQTGLCQPYPGTDPVHFELCP